jgi:two-component system sensor histidine kinase KdpD
MLLAVTMSGRGCLRIYLGAAPGVGKTFAMLEEGRRRAGRGTDVLIGFVETHGRRHTIEQLGELPVLPRRTVHQRGGSFEEFDVAAVLARRPQLVLVDDLAHTNVPGSGHPKRWQDVQELLDAGIDVLSTVNVQQLESLQDVVQTITGVPQRETVPDSVVRAAEQVQLVDMTPEALRRRMAHGNIYPAEKVDAALGSYFRPGNLTALRELALLWLADQVEEGLQRYREQHGIPNAWQTRERVVVALSGGPEGEVLIRRAARIAARSGATGVELIAVHISGSDTVRGPGPAGLNSQRLLVESLGGTYHSLIGTDVPRALLDFARGADATQIVLGASRRRPFSAALTGPGTGQTVTRLAGPIDVHIAGHDYAGRGFRLPRLGYGLSPRRRIAGVLTAAVLLGVGTPALTTVRSDLTFATDLSIYLLIVVLTSLVGGFWAAVLAAVVGSVLLNYYFAPPLHTFTITDSENVLALAIFLIVGVLVSRVVDLSARRSVLAARASAEAEALSTLAGSLLRGEHALDALLARVQETFGMHSVSLLAREQGSWRTLAAIGPEPPGQPADADGLAEIDERQTLALSGRPLSVDDQRILAAFAAEVSVAYRQRELTEKARGIESLAESERARTALLNAVSHDLRTPIATAKAAVSSLLAADVTWSEADRQELLASAEDSLDRLTDLVTNLLDLSRLQAGVLPVLVAPVALEEVALRAVDHVAPSDALLDIDLPISLPEVTADAGLLERVIANLLQNALRYAPAGTRVSLAGSTHAGLVELRVVDRGPGIAAGEADLVFAAFQRRDDASTGGVGLGLAIARGFAEAMGGTVFAEETPGGGATLVVQLKAAKTGEAP